MDKTFRLTVTEQELNVLSAGLVELPYKVSAPLITKLQGQIGGQLRSAAAGEPQE